LAVVAGMKTLKSKHNQIEKKVFYSIKSRKMALVIAIPLYTAVPNLLILTPLNFNLLIPYILPSPKEVPFLKGSTVYRFTYTLRAR